MKILTQEKLSEHKYKTPEGYLICVDAVLARTGKQSYRRSEVFDDGSDEIVEIDRTPEEVFSEATLASFENKPVTVEHPNESVNVENYKDYAVGFVRDVHKAVADGQDVIAGTLVITDEQTIREIEQGQHVELSCGYDCDIEDGENPMQKNIRGNHVALCEQGRAGCARIIDSVEDASEFFVIVTPDSSGIVISIENDINVARKIKRQHNGRIYKLNAKHESDFREALRKGGSRGTYDLLRSYIAIGFAELTDSVDDAVFKHDEAIQRRLKEKGLTFRFNEKTDEYTFVNTDDMVAAMKIFHDSVTDAFTESPESWNAIRQALNRYAVDKEGKLMLGGHHIEFISKFTVADKSEFERESRAIGNAIHEVEKKYGVPITFNAGVGGDYKIHLVVDIREKYVPDSIDDAFTSKSVYYGWVDFDFDDSRWNSEWDKGSRLKGQSRIDWAKERLNRINEINDDYLREDVKDFLEALIKGNVKLIDSCAEGRNETMHDASEPKALYYEIASYDRPNQNFVGKRFYSFESLNSFVKSENENRDVRNESYKTYLGYFKLIIDTIFKVDDKKYRVHDKNDAYMMPYASYDERHLKDRLFNNKMHLKEFLKNPNSYWDRICVKQIDSVSKEAKMVRIVKSLGR